VTFTASAPAVEIEMATLTGVERALFVFWLEEKKSSTQVERKFRTQYRKEPPSRLTIYSWHKNFLKTGFSVLHAKSPGRPRVSDATVEQLTNAAKMVHKEFCMQMFHRIQDDEIFLDSVIFSYEKHVSYQW
jgi:hypothetical protein